MSKFVISFLQQNKISFKVNDCCNSVGFFPSLPRLSVLRCECSAPFRVFPLHLIQVPVGGSMTVCMPFYARVLMSACGCGGVLVSCVCELHDSWAPANSRLKLHKKRSFFFSWNSAPLLMCVTFSSNCQ